MSTIKRDFSVIQQKILEFENINLHRSVEIQRLPNSNGERLNDIALKLIQLQSITLDLSNIDICYRNKSEKSIVLRFLQLHARKLFFDGFKASDAKGLDTPQLNIGHHRSCDSTRDITNSQCGPSGWVYLKELGAPSGWSLLQKVK